MAIEIQSQVVNATSKVSQQVSVSKDQVISKDMEQGVKQSAPKAEQAKEVVTQAFEIPEKSQNSLELPKETIQDAVNKLQDYVDKYNRDLKFSIDDDTGRTVVRLLDNDKNVVKQYPSEDVLKLISNLEQNKGLFIGKA